jgi:hypothetical protein
VGEEQEGERERRWQDTERDTLVSSLDRGLRALERSEVEREFVWYSSLSGGRAELCK